MQVCRKVRDIIIEFLGPDVVRISTQDLKQIKHNTKNGLFELTKDGFIIMEIAKKDRLIIISPDGASITLVNRSQKNKAKEYRFEKMPSKLIPYYEYAAQIIQLLRQMQSKKRD